MSPLNSTFPALAPIRLLIVDDHVLVREGLISLIKPQPDITVVGQAGMVGEALDLARQLRPDLILMDITLPDGSGSQATRKILAELPDTRIVFLTAHEEDDELFAAIASGASGYLLKSVRSAELLDQLRAVMRGEVVLSPTIARRILDAFAQQPPPAPEEAAAENVLSERELEVVRLLARGAGNREIAQQLVISENTVRNHVSNILAKLHVHSRRDVVHYARRLDRGAPPLKP